MQTIDVVGPAPDRSDVDAVLDDLGRAVGAIRCAASQRVLRLGISMTHLHVLTLLRHHGSLPMSRVADLLDASVSSATGIVDRMEERGLVERVRVPDDRRVVLVRATAQGEGLVDDVEIVRGEFFRSVLARLDAAQLERFAAAMADLRAAVADDMRDAPDRYAGPASSAGPAGPDSTTTGRRPVGA